MVEKNMFPFVSVSGINSIEVMSKVQEIVYSDFSKSIHKVVAGLLTTSNTLNGMKEKSHRDRFPDTKTLIKIAASVNKSKIVNVIHHRSMKEDNLFEDLLGIMKIVGKKISGIQIDTIPEVGFPNPIILSKFKEKYPKISLILQIGPKAFEEINDNSSLLKKKLEKYDNSISGILLDKSDSQGIKLDASTNEGNVAVINTNTNSLTTTIEVGDGPIDLLYGPKNGDIYVANSNSSSVSVINETSNSVINTIPVGVDPVSMTYDSKNGIIYIADESTGDISIINATDSTFHGTVHVGNETTSITYDSNNNELYITEDVNISGEGFIEEIPDNNLLSAIQDTTKTVITMNTTNPIEINDTIHVGGSPDAITYDPINGNSYVADADSRTVSVINMTTDEVTANIIVGSNPNDILYADGNVYVANTNSSSVSVIDTTNNNITATIEVNGNPSGIAYNPQNHKLYVTLPGENLVEIINTSSNTIEANITVTGTPTDVVFDVNNSNIYVAEESSNLIAVINTTTNQVIETITVGQNPTSLTVDTNNGDVFVTAQSQNQSATIELYDINGTTNHVTNEVQISSGTEASVAFDSQTNEVIVADESSSTISVVNANTHVVEETVSVSSAPTSITYEPTTNTIVVVSSTADTVTVITPGL